MAEPTLQNNNVCGTTFLSTNLSCVSPPEKVNVSWFLQSIDGIQDVDEIFTLNMVRGLARCAPVCLACADSLACFSRAVRS